MIWTIKVPDEIVKQIDIKEIYVATEGDLEKLVKFHPLDDSFESKTGDASQCKSATEFNDLVLKTSLEYGTNLVYSAPGGELIFYRVNEQKRPGRDYPGLGVGVVIENNLGEIAMTLRGGITNNRGGLWGLPGGTVEFREEIEEQVPRESEEETGLIVKYIGCYGIYQDFPGEQHWLSLGCAAKLISGELINAESFKSDAVDWFDPRLLPENTSLLTVRNVRDYLDANGKYWDIPVIRE